MTRIRTAPFVAGAALALVLLPGCDTFPGSAPAGRAAGNVSLAAAEVDGLGAVVTDGNGMTLYIFGKDKNQPSVSTCNGDCAATWPPILVTTDTVAVEGIDDGLVGFVTRQDGAQQVTLDGWPLYQYVEDEASGDAKGQGVGGTWFAVTPQGQKAVGNPTVDEGYTY